jgi:hypothetical protein
VVISAITGALDTHHVELERAEHAVAGPAQVAGRGRHPVGPHRDEPPFAHRGRVGHERPDRLGSLIAGRPRRHRHPDVPGGDGDGRLGVEPLVRRDELLDQLALLGARVPRGPLGAGVGQVRLHGGPGPLQGAVGRGDAGAERRGGLAGRPAEDVAGDQRRALSRRQDLERGQERQRDGLPRDGYRLGLLVTRRGRLEQQVRVGLQPRHLGKRVRRGPPGAVPEHVQADVGGDPVQPGAELRSAVEAGPAAPGFQERLLHRVLSLVERGQHPVAVDVQLTPVPFGQGRERGMIHPQPLLRSTSWSNQMLPSGSAKSANDW